MILDHQLPQTKLESPKNMILTFSNHFRLFLVYKIINITRESINDV